MKSDATIVAVVRTWLFAVTAVSGLIVGSAAFAHDGKKHTDENPHVLYGTEALLMLDRGEVIATDTHLNEEGPVWYLLVRNPLTTNLWECTGTFPRHRARKPRPGAALADSTGNTAP